MQRKVLIVSVIITLLVICSLTLNRKLPEKVDQKQFNNLETTSEQEQIGVQAPVQEINKGESKPSDPKPEQKVPFTSKSESTVKSRDSLERDLINLINNDRKKNGLKALKIDAEVTDLARKKSEDMKNNNYFSTKSPNYGEFTDMLKASNIKYRTAAEKIAGGYQSAQEVFNNWLKEPDFRKSILEPNLTDIGVGYASGGGEYRYYWSLWLIEKPAPISDGNKSSYEKEVLELVNVERSNKGLQPLQWDNQLAEVARAKSKDMRDKNYFAHQSPTYGSLGEMLKSFNVSYNSAAENIAAGQKTPDAVVKAWMNSEGHRKNILDPKLTHLGVGYADGGGEYFVYWTQTFTTKP